MPRPGRARVPALVLATLLAVVLSGCATTLGAHLAKPGMHHRMGQGSSRCQTSTHTTTGATVHVVLMDMGRRSGMTGRMVHGRVARPGRMAGRMGGMTHGEMRLAAFPGSVSAGQVTFVAVDRGSRTHELVVLPLAGHSATGQRRVAADRAVDESTSLGEASRSCGAGAGDGLLPGSSGWTTLNLAPGRYELVCNRPGHYARGMYAELVVVG